MRDEIKKVEVQFQEEKEHLELKHKNMEAKFKIQQVDLEKQVLDMTQTNNETKRELDKALHDFANMPEDPEKIALRAEVAEKEKQIDASQVALKTFVSQQSVLEAQIDEVKVPYETKITELESKNQASDKVIEKLKKEHEELKDVLQMEMMRAEETCRILEKQFRELPNPFEAEMAELREKVCRDTEGSQSCAGREFQA